MTITKKIPADRWHGLDVHLGDSLQVIAVTESEFLVQISRADKPPEPSVGQAANGCDLPAAVCRWPPEFRPTMRGWTFTRRNMGWAADAK